MKNKKGFVLTETLVVTVFLVTIFTFVYVSIIPLFGKYEDMAYRDADIDIVYKLYNIRKMISNDDNNATIASNTFKRITCSDLNDTTSCNKLIEYLELNNYILVYADNIQNRLTDFSNFNTEMYKYVSKHKDFNERVLVLLDQNRHTIAHLLFK